jgi:hypothetical protein
VSVYTTYTDHELVLRLKIENEAKPVFTELYNRYWKRLLIQAFHKLNLEKDRIPFLFINTVYNCDERQRCIYLQHHQKCIIRLADKVYHYLLPKDPASIYQQTNDVGIVNFYKEVYRCLDELLNFIEQNFRDYFNQDEYVTEVYLQIGQDGIRTRLKELQKLFSKKKADDALVKIALEPVMQFCRKQKASYKQLLYIKGLVQHLYPAAGRLVRGDDKDINKKIIGALLYLNFNNGGFASYCLTSIVNTVNALPEQKQKITRLLAYKKRFNQLRMKQGIALRANHESVKDQISKWINEEIHYTETKQQLLSIAPTIKDDEMLSDEDRLHFSVSVHVLGILARAAHESKLLLNKNGTAVFRNVAKYCRTV